MGSIRFEKDGAVGVVSMAKPPHNLIDNAMQASLGDAYATAVQAGCRSILHCSEMRHFCAGADLDSITSQRWSQDELVKLWAQLQDAPGELGISEAEIAALQKQGAVRSRRALTGAFD